MPPPSSGSYVFGDGANEATENDIASILKKQHPPNVYQALLARFQANDGVVVAPCGPIRLILSAARNMQMYYISYVGMGSGTIGPLIILSSLEHPLQAQAVGETTPAALVEAG